MIHMKKNILKQTREIVVKVIVPIFAYAAYGYLTQNNQPYEKRTIVHEYEKTRPDSLYGRAAKAISESDMSSYYKSQALRNLLSNETDAYYEAVISIATGSMSSYYKHEAISNLDV